MQKEELKFKKAFFLRKKLYIVDKPRYMNISLENGENDLSEISKSGVKEACWIFSHDQERWYSGSLELLQFEGGAGIRGYNADLSQLGSKVTHYHTHNKGLLENEIEKLMKESRIQAIKNGKDFKEEYFRMVAHNLSYLGAFIPSQDDMKSSVNMIHTTSRNTDLEFKIFTDGHETVLTLDRLKINNDLVSRFKKLYTEFLTETEVERFSHQNAIQTLLPEYVSKINNANLGVSLNMTLHSYDKI